MLLRLILALGCAGLAVAYAPGQTTGFWRMIEGARLANLTNDTDGDGILDEREVFLGTDPRSRDTDADGFEDLFEDVYRHFGFDPLRMTVDTDRDGLSDAFEAQLGTARDNPNTDGDDYGDFDEVLNASFGYDPLTRTVDTDFDGLTDSLEARLGTSPDNPDSDGDGINDFQEYRAGSNPLARDRPEELGELLSKTYGPAMEQAILTIRGGGDFPAELAEELPYPDVTAAPYRALAKGQSAPSPAFKLSSALLQQAIYNFGPLYPSFIDFFSQLGDIAQRFDGDPRPDIVRLYEWSEKTSEGYPISLVKISDNPQKNECEREILFMGVHHARELITLSITMGLIKELTSGYAANDAAIKQIVDSSEIWIMPLVNPEGYSAALGEFQAKIKVDSRKNRRKVAELTPSNMMQTKLGVDPNRNYGFEHIRTLTDAERDALGPEGKYANGLDFSGDFDPNSENYAGHMAFSDAEPRAVKGLASNNLMGGQIHGINCSLSWHSFGGQVFYPMAHDTSNGVNPSHVPQFEALANAFAAASGYQNIHDTYKDIAYPAYGTSEDWLYKEKGVFALTVEAYSSAERGGAGPEDFPDTTAKRDAVVMHNIAGALAFINACPQPLCIDVIFLGDILSLIFNTAEGTAYVVEYKTSLDESSWSTLQEVQGNGQTATVRDGSIPTSGRRFYRVRER